MNPKRERRSEPIRMARLKEIETERGEPCPGRFRRVERATNLVEIGYTRAKTGWDGSAYAQNDFRRIMMSSDVWVAACRHKLTRIGKITSTPLFPRRPNNVTRDHDATTTNVPR